MRDGDLRRWLRGAVIGLGAALLALAAVHLPLAETYENRTFDVRSRLFADPSRADRGIVAVVIDQKSLDAVAAPRDSGGLEQGWPWPRDFHAALVRYLSAAGARAIVFDLVFSEPSIYTQVGVADDDTAFAEASTGQRVVQSIVLTREAGSAADRAWAPALREAPVARRLSAAPEDRFDKATLPIPALLAAARTLGWIGFDPDDDGVARALRPTVTYAPAGARRRDRSLGACRSPPRWPRGRASRSAVRAPSAASWSTVARFPSTKTAAWCCASTAAKPPTTSSATRRSCARRCARPRGTP